MEDMDKEEFTPRGYQFDLFEKALVSNSIIYLPTGSGKTLIAIMLIKKLSESIQRPWNEGAKRTFFLVNTVPLVQQQCAYINRHSHLVCRGYTGELNLDFWDNSTWTSEFITNQVLVMTSQIMLDILNRGFITLDRINLIIFDECHHAVGCHPMRLIMKMFESCPPDSQPRILGTSATLLNCNVICEKVETTIRELEVTFHAKIITVDSLDTVVNYAKPIESIIYHETPSELPIHEELETCINHSNRILSVVHLPQVHNESSKEFLARSKNVKLKCIFEEIREHYQTHGLYFTFQAILYHMVQIEQRKKFVNDLQSTILFNFLITQLIIMRKIIADEMKGTSELMNMSLYSSDKILRLFSTILKFYHESLNSGNTFSCIIFVRRRFSTKVLYHVLKLRAQEDENFKFLIPEYIIGSSKDALKSPKEQICLRKWSEEALNKFRAGIANCLVATDVVDEGVDIPACSLVIRYDFPQDFRAYVQSKGRARHKNSRFVILLPRDPAYLSKFSSYRNIEQFLSTKLIGNSSQRTIPLSENIEKILYATDIQPFSVTNIHGVRSIITETSAISLLNHYCSKLSSTKFLTCSPTWILHRNENGSNFMVTLTLPMTSPLRETIYGDLMSSITLAKRSVAMKTCKRLYEIGELNDNLLPKNNAEVSEDITPMLVNWEKEAEEDGENLEKIGTVYNKRSHDLVYTEAFYAASPKSNEDCYVHIISIKPTYSKPIENRNRAVYDMLNDRAGYAILSSKKIPIIPNFPIYISAGALEVKIDVNFEKVNLSFEQINQLKQSHLVIFKDVLELVKSFMIFDNENKENSYFIVPVDKNWQIDWNVVQEHLAFRRQSVPNYSTKEIINDTKPVPVIENDDWQLVTPNYRNLTNLYFVTRVCDELTPKSVFPTDDYSTYIHYFSERHGLNISNEKQPLLEVKLISKKINCIKPRQGERTTRKRNRSDLEEHLVPELCNKVNFPALYWLKATLLPSILHRISQFYIADDLRRLIAVEANLGLVGPLGNTQWQLLESQEYYNDDNTDSFSQMEIILDENISLDNTKSDLTPSISDIDALSLLPNRYPWPKDQEPCDLDRNIEKVQQIDIDYYHFFTKTWKNVEGKIIASKYKRKGYAKISEIPVPLLQILKLKNVTEGPSATDILPALTPKFANDIFNLERLETLGDSFLKFITVIFLFTKFPTYNEGRLASMKNKIIGNRHLFYCGRSKNIPGRLKIDDFEPSSNFIVPSFCVPRQLQTAIKVKNKSPNVLYEINISSDEQIEGRLSAAAEANCLTQIDAWIDAKNTTGVEQFVGFQVVKDKTVSDAVESLTGVYLNKMGLDGAARFLQWIGVFPNNIDIKEILYVSPSSACIGNGNINDHNTSFNYIENVLGYKFADRSFLLQALTHPSYNSNRITNSYERLEFIGDAVIDFLITVYIYENCGNLSPGALTDLRSALVNNITFACFTVKYGIHTALLSYDSLLPEIIERFVKYQEERDHIVNDELLWILLEEEECNAAQYVDVPKVLGDLFESLIGAVYLDSHKDLTIVWRILYGLMHNEIDSFSKNVPKQPVRVLYETQGACPRFLKASDVNGQAMVPLEVFILGKKKLFHGFGANKKQAKAAAAKQALKSLRLDV